MDPDQMPLITFSLDPVICVSWCNLITIYDRNSEIMPAFNKS